MGAITGGLFEQSGFFRPGSSEMCGWCHTSPVHSLYCQCSYVCYLNVTFWLRKPESDHCSPAAVVCVDLLQLNHCVISTQKIEWNDRKQINENDIMLYLLVKKSSPRNDKLQYVCCLTCECSRNNCECLVIKFLPTFRHLHLFWSTKLLFIHIFIIAHKLKGLD